MILSQDEFDASVHALMKRLVARYESLASEMAKIGAHDLEDIFRTLIKEGESASPARKVARSKPAKANGPVPVAGGKIDEPELAAVWNAYAVWAYAVRNEVQLFEDLTSLSLPIENEDLRNALGLEARACLDRAARYRVQRRLAFHADRLANSVAQFPDVRRIDSYEDLAHVALAIERYFLALCQRFEDAAIELARVIGATAHLVGELERTVESSEPPRRLRNALKRLEDVSFRKGVQRPVTRGDVAKVAFEADRIFDYYDRVFEASLDLEVTAEAQRLAAAAVERLRILKELQSAA